MISNPVQSDLVLAISSDNHMLHVGPAAEMVNHLRGDPAAKQLEFYDARGQRRSIDSLESLEGDGAEAQAAGNGGVEDVMRTAPPELGKNQQVLLRRIRAALDFAQTVLTARPELGEQGPNFPVETEVPRPHGSYPEVLEQLTVAFDSLAPSNRGNWLHNLYHAATGTS